MLEGEQVDEDAKIIGVVGGLTIETELWKSMNKEWPKTYVEFRERAGVIVTMAEVIFQEMGDKKDTDQKKGTDKKGGDYKPPGNMRSFTESAETQENLKKVLSISVDALYDEVENRGWLSAPRKIIQERSKLNKWKFCAYHGDIGHYTSECRDLLRQLWNFYEDGKLTEFVKKLLVPRTMAHKRNDDDKDDQEEDLRNKIDYKRRKAPPMPEGSQPNEILML
ncbi:hypothetical protein ACS0TY_009359 [Phlomoides rotata]